mgnify:CR=1 FL=1
MLSNKNSSIITLNNPISLKVIFPVLPVSATSWRLSWIRSARTSSWRPPTGSGTMSIGYIGDFVNRICCGFCQSDILWILSIECNRVDNRYYRIGHEWDNFIHFLHGYCIFFAWKYSLYDNISVGIRSKEIISLFHYKYRFLLFLSFSEMDFSYLL